MAYIASFPDLIESGRGAIGGFDEDSAIGFGEVRRRGTTLAHPFPSNPIQQIRWVYFDAQID